MTGAMPKGTEIIFMRSHPQSGNTGRVVEWVENETFGKIPRIQVTSGPDVGKYCFAVSPDQFGKIPVKKKRWKAVVNLHKEAVKKENDKHA